MRMSLFLPPDLSPGGSTPPPGSAMGRSRTMGYPPPAESKQTPEEWASTQGLILRSPRGGGVRTQTVNRCVQEKIKMLKSLCSGKKRDVLNEEGSAKMPLLSSHTTQIMYPLPKNEPTPRGVFGEQNCAFPVGGKHDENKWNKKLLTLSRHFARGGSRSHDLKLQHRTLFAVWV